jgi:hypothetical protein
MNMYKLSLGVDQELNFRILGLLPVTSTNYSQAGDVMVSINASVVRQPLCDESGVGFVAL